MKPFRGSIIDSAHPHMRRCRCWWPAWDSTGRLTEVRSGFHGLRVGATWVTSEKGPAVNFDGNDHITTSLADPLVDFTAMGWFKSTAVNTFDRIMDKDHTDGFWLGRSSSNANTWGGGVWESSPPFGRFVTLQDGEWHHIASVRRGSTHTIVGNGGQVTVSGTVPNTLLSADSLRFGSNQSGGDRFTGQLQDLRIYSRALTIDEIRDIMLNPWAPVIGWYDDFQDVHNIISNGGVAETLFVGTPTLSTGMRSRRFSGLLR